MTDVLERDLAAKLRAVGETVPDMLAPPPDLEVRVQRARRQRRGSRGAIALGIAALVAVLVGTVALVDRAPGRRVDITTPSRNAAPEVGSNVVMIDARGRYVVALDAGGHQVATLATARRGSIVDAQLERDNRTLWYLSVAGHDGTDCGEVVRADLRSGASKIVAHAVAFAISPDGTKLALGGRGNLSNGTCASMTGKTRLQVVVRDLDGGQVAEWTENASARELPRIRWSPDGRELLAEPCAPSSCELRVLDVRDGATDRLDATPITIAPTGRFAFGGSYLWTVESDEIAMRAQLAPYEGYKQFALGSLRVNQVVPTRAGIYVVGVGPDRKRALYRLANDGRFERVKTFDYGWITAISQ